MISLPLSYHLNPKLLQLLAFNIKNTQILPKYMGNGNTLQVNVGNSSFASHTKQVVEETQ